ncbi:MAG TPA: YdeI/OmpD-associated family protein [Candidatus Thermoplasmatota archaeon]
MNLGKTLYVKNRRAWRAWLRKNHATARDIWLVYPRKATGKKRIPYNDAVEEALCFGWIDSNLKGIDEERFAQRFTPRRKGANLSAMNWERVERLVRGKKMTKAGLVVLGKLGSLKVEVPPAVKRALSKTHGAKAEFERLPDSYKRIRIGYIEAGRNHGRAEYAKRVRHFVAMTANGKKFGTWKGDEASKKK